MVVLLALSMPAFARAPGAGDVAFTEVMIKPAAPLDRLEWFELVNNTTDTIELNGCTLVEGNLNTGTWAGRSTPLPNAVNSLALLPRDRVVLAKSTSQDDGDPRYSGNTTCVGYPSASNLADACLAEAVDLFSGSTFFSNDEPESLCIVCGGAPNPDTSVNPCEVPGTGTIIDAVTFDWTAFEGQCPGGENCTVALRPAQDTIGSAANNDNPEAWCLSENTYYDPLDDGIGGAIGRLAYGSPGSPAACEDLQPPCGAGDVAFTELMIAAAPSTEEWMELKVTGSEACRLSDCTVERDSLDGGEPGVHVLANLPHVQPGDYLLLGRTSSTIYVSTDPEVLVDEAYGHNTLTMPQDAAFALRLRCDGAVVDEVELDWRPFADRCLVPEATSEDVACSLNLRATAESASGNDDLDSWCLPARDTLYTNEEGGQFTGTPGFEGSCDSVEGAPNVGGVVFTEVMADPAGTNEWIELTNVTDADANLFGCWLKRHRLDEDGNEDDVDTFVLGGSGEPVVLGRSSRVFARNGCVELTEEDTACSYNYDELAYEGIDLTASNTEHLSLVCADAQLGEVVIDTMSFNLEEQGIRDGHSLAFDPEIDQPASANDDPEAWCEAAFSQQFLTVEEGDCNYGTPGVAGGAYDGADCVVDPPDYPEGKLAFRCQGVGGGAAWWGLLALPLVLLRRRRMA